MTTQAADARVKNLAVVEVRKNPESTLWYNAFLQDLAGDLATVSFDIGGWPDRKVPCSSIRARPDAADSEDVVDFQLHDLVEVKVAESTKNPTGWTLGTVTGTKDGFFSIKLTNAQNAIKLPAENLRPVSQESPLDPLELFRRAVPVDEALHQWLLMPDARGCVEQVREMAGLAHAGIGSSEHGIFSTELAGHLTPDSIIFIGQEHAVRRGTLLLQVHFMHQRDVETFHERRAHKLHLLKDLENRDTNAACQISFDVESDLIGRTIGKGGENAKRVEAKHSVEVRLVDGKGESVSGMVRILGATVEACEIAREDLELIRVEYAVDEDRVGWILGKGHKDVQEIGQKAGLVYAPRLNEAGKALELCGLRQNVENAELLLNTQNEYFSIYQEMAQQNDEINGWFEALDVRAESVGLRVGPRKRPASPSREKASPAGRTGGKGAGRGHRGGQAQPHADAPGRKVAEAEEQEHEPEVHEYVSDKEEDKILDDWADDKVAPPSKSSPKATADADASATPEVPAARQPRGRGRGGGGRGQDGKVVEDADAGATSGGSRGRGRGGRGSGQATSSRPIGEGSSDARTWRAKRSFNPSES